LSEPHLILGLGELLWDLLPERPRLGGAPTNFNAMAGQRGFERRFLGDVKRTKVDAIAEYRIMANQPEGEYASSNAESCSIWRWKG